MIYYNRFNHLSKSEVSEKPVSHKLDVLLHQKTVDSNEIHRQGLSQKLLQHQTEYFYAFTELVWPIKIIVFQTQKRKSKEHILSSCYVYTNENQFRQKQK